MHKFEFGACPRALSNGNAFIIRLCHSEVNSRVYLKLKIASTWRIYVSTLQSILGVPLVLLCFWSFEVMCPIDVAMRRDVPLVSRNKLSP